MDSAGNDRLERDIYSQNQDKLGISWVNFPQAALCQCPLPGRDPPFRDKGSSVTVAHQCLASLGYS